MNKNLTFKVCVNGNRRAQMKKILVASGFLIIAHTSVYAQVASFDCKRASTATEHAICKTPALGARDLKMASYYQILQEAHPAVGGMAYREFRDNIHGEQSKWMKSERDICRSSIDCLTRAYDQRIKALHETLLVNIALTYGRSCDGG